MTDTYNFPSYLRNLRPPSAPKGKLVVAIDFGTTFTGVAYAHSDANLFGEGSALTPEQIRDKVTVVKSWPNVQSSYAEKVPSILAYDSGHLIAWGSKVKPTQSTQVSHFKLGLQDGANEHYDISKNDESPLGGFLTDPNWIHPLLPKLHAIDYATDYLREVRTYIIDKVFPKDFGEGFLGRQNIKYVLTVPAIWDDKARDLTKRAAVNAGFREEDLTLITEPEAAALYCSTLCHETDLKDGDCFLICDAGGGTVDLISYQLVSKRPFKIKECVKGTGAACGSIFLAKNFEKLLRDHLGHHCQEVLTPKRVKEAVTHFEGNLKLNFNPYEEYCDNEFEIPLPGAPDIPSVNLEAGYLKLTKNQLMSKVFVPIFNKIAKLVHSQRSAVEKNHEKGIKVLFLVGGFGTNEFLASYLGSQNGSGVIIKQPGGGHSAIMRGAVLYELGLKVGEHCMRRHYGIVCSVPFLEGQHPPHRKHVTFAGLEYCTGVFDWVAKMNSRQPYGHVIKIRLSQEYSSKDWEGKQPLPFSMNLWVSEAPNPPIFDDKSHVSRILCTAKGDARMLPQAAVSKKFGLSEGTYYEVTFQVALHFLTTLEFKIMSNEKLIGTAVVDYA